MQTNFYITVAFNGEIINYTTHSEPKVGDKFFHNGKELEVTKISQTLQFVDLLRNAMYYTCIAKEVVSNNPLVGVTQVKFITCPFSGNDAVKSLEDALNEFLWETRHTHHILDITHTNMYIAVKYRLYNDRDIERSKSNEKQYQRNQSNHDW
jgi:hypothetical protein